MKTTLILITCLLAGCGTNLKVKLPGGFEILYQKSFMEASAKGAVLGVFTKDYTVIIAVDDPNSSVNPGTLKFIEPRTGVEVGMTAGGGE